MFLDKKLIFYLSSQDLGKSIKELIERHTIYPPYKMGTWLKSEFKKIKGKITIGDGMK